MDGYSHGMTIPSPGPAPREAGSRDGATARVMQRTLKAAIDCVGTGLHSGARVAIALRPAPVGHGIVFRRRDLGVDIPARFDCVADTRLCTVLAHPAIAAARVATVEHLMAALAGTGITNALVEVDGPELPILDGSAASFVFLIDCAGIQDQEVPATCLEVLRRVRVDGPDGGYAELSPPSMHAPVGLAVRVAIEFAAPAIGAQAIALQVTPRSFRKELAAARTFALHADIEAMQAAGLARGGSLDNAVVVDGGRVLNPSGLRMEREFVRHKALDAVGDLALGGVVLHASLQSHRAGHALNNRVLRALLEDPANWRLLDGAPPASLAAAPLAATSA